MAIDLDRVVLVPVIHADLESVDHARKVVREVKPQVVAVELDHERYQQLLNPKTNEELPEPSPSGDIVQDLMLHLALLEKNLGDLTGSYVGDEMMAAIEEGRNVGARIALVDRPIQTTIQGLMQIPLDEVYRLASLVPDASKEIEGGQAKDVIDMLKEEGAVEDIMGQFRKEFPALSDVLIRQRDMFVAQALRSILDDVNGKIVAILGAGHIDGVRNALIEILQAEKQF